MKLGLITTLTFALTTCAAACPPPPAPGPGADAGVLEAPPAPAPSPMVTAACAAMKAAQCPEGSDPNCAAVITKIVADKLTPINVPCLAAAGSAPAVRACGIACAQ